MSTKTKAMPKTNAKAPKPANKDSDRTSPEVEYLRQNLGPILVAALAEICARRPSDPVEYLGHWLLRWRFNDNLKRRDVENALDSLKQQYQEQLQGEEENPELVEYVSNLPVEAVNGLKPGSVAEGSEEEETEIPFEEEDEVPESEFNASDEIYEAEQAALTKKLPASAISTKNKPISEQNSQPASVEADRSNPTTPRVSQAESASSKQGSDLSPPPVNPLPARSSGLKPSGNPLPAGASSLKPPGNPGAKKSKTPSIPPSPRVSQIFEGKDEAEAENVIPVPQAATKKPTSSHHKKHAKKA